MALPGHSPTPYMSGGSPPRMMNGHTEPYHHHSHSYGHPRPMLPPSPGYQPRYHIPTPSTQPHVPPYDAHPPPPAQLPNPPYKRPSSGMSMSLSSILGGEPERHPQDMAHGHKSQHSRPSSISNPPQPYGLAMSPPQQPARAGTTDYHYRPRSPPYIPNRQRSTSSTMPPNRPLFEYAPPPAPFSHSHHFDPGARVQEEADARARRTSISGLLQRPNSQPTTAPPVQAVTSFPPSQPPKSNWSLDPPNYQQEQPPPPPPPQHRANGFSSYDTRPPGLKEPARSVPLPQLATPSQSQSASPDLRRSQPNGTPSRGLAGLLNATTSQSIEPTSAPSYPMMRQDSARSQSERSITDRGRHYSPFASSFNSQPAFLDEQGRKGSDEIAHKAIVGLGLDNRRGRYSPVPQAVQGAQAQTPVPDGGVKSEQGRIFSGLGGSMGTTPTPAPPIASPFKRDSALAKSTDDNPSSVRGGTKRPRKTADEQNGDSESKRSVSGAKPGKRPKVQNSYKADLEEMATTNFQPRTTLAGLTGARRTATPSNAGPTSNPSQRYDTQPIFRPRKTVKVGTIMTQTLKKPRRHLGTFQYDPEICIPDRPAPGDPDFDVSIRPRMIPSFAEVDDVNCIYSIRVSRMWLRDKERRLICSSRNLWGTGIYTDDSDPIAAAVHMGFLKGAFNNNIDESLLNRVIEDQNPKVDVPRDLRPPSKPLVTTESQDLKITLVVMPQLESYAQTSRFGISSRPWPPGPEQTHHDGVSFSVLKVEAVELGTEERRSGRTGASKRARLQAQLAARQSVVGPIISPVANAPAILVQ